MAGDQTAATDAADTPEGGRQRSSIAFPYSDLAAPIQLALAIHENVGTGVCDDTQLSAWTNQSLKSSSFRTQVYAARMFGILGGEAGKHRLTELGRAIVDPQQARESKTRAFLTVPLYKAAYEKYKGGVIPPAAALERDFVGMGVADKQKDRARQVFERAAEQAGFFEHGRNRLVAPGIQQGAEPPKFQVEENGGGGGGGGDGLTGDPLIDALVKKLPKAGRQWPAAERQTWMKMMSMAFDLAYGVSDSNASLQPS